MAKRGANDRGPGVFLPPPLFFAVALGTAWWLDGRWPFRLASRALWLELAGALLVVLSIAGALWAAGRFARAGTPVVPVKAATALVTDGPFRYSRNPMYLSLVLGYLGVGLIINSGWALVLLPAVVLVVRGWVIPREERHLASVFGDAYAAYCRRVRRWL